MTRGVGDFQEHIRRKQAVGNASCGTDVNVRRWEAFPGGETFARLLLLLFKHFFHGGLSPRDAGRQR